MEVVVTTGAIRCAKLQSNGHRQQTNTQHRTVKKILESVDSKWFHIMSMMQASSMKMSNCTCTNMTQYRISWLSVVVPAAAAAATFSFCLTGLFFLRSLQVRLSPLKVFQRRTFEDQQCEIFISQLVDCCFTALSAQTGYIMPQE